MDKEREYETKHYEMRENRRQNPWLEELNEGESIYLLELKEWKPKEKEWAAHWEACGTANDYDSAITNYIHMLETFPQDHIRVIEVQVIGAICTHTPKFNK
jgi:hypothetical protein